MYKGGRLGNYPLERKIF